jgi:tRNA (guanine37-N1)-methyltransferase
LAAVRIDVLTLFPEVFEPYLSASIIGRARQRGLVSVRCVNYRHYTEDKHRTVDDRPFGGGPGMVLMCEPIFRAMEAIEHEGRQSFATPVREPERSPQEDEQCLAGACGEPKIERNESAIDPGGLATEESASGSSLSQPSATAMPAPTRVLLTPQGEPLRQSVVEELAAEPWLALLCGHYEGFDERIREGLAFREISIGDYVLSGGELPALVLIDAVVRLLPGALGHEEAAAADSFSEGLLDHPHYTRPREFRGMKVPEVLFSGDHARVAAWRREQAERRTRARRPDLFDAEASGKSLADGQAE